MRPMSAYSFRSGLNPGFKSVKFFLLLSVAISGSAILLEKLFLAVGLPVPNEIFSLSSWCYDKFFIWQIFTYPFLQPAYYGLSFGYLFSFAFQAYLLWMTGTAICQRKGQKSFVLFYVTAALFTGLSLVFFHLSFPGLPLFYCGSNAMAYSLLIAWIMLNPGARMLLLFAFPFKATTLVGCLLAFHLFIEFASGAYINAIAYASAAVFGFLYSVLVWNTEGSPMIISWKKYFSALFNRSPTISSKIYDIQTGKTIMSDKTFFHAALAKISLKGKKSLTFRER